MRKLVFSGIVENWKKWHMNQIMLLTIAVALLGLLAAFSFFSKDADISALDNVLNQATVIYDINEEVASKVTANKNEGTPIEKVPDHMKDALVAIEDHRFYNHSGVDLIGIARAFFRNLMAGGVVEGGSTITQQLAKNALLDSEKTYSRKLREATLARAIEKEFSKDEILQMYLNTIYFGDGAWGINRAAKKYFGKEVEELSLAESAMLAGLIKAPSALNPYNDLEKSIARRNVVLTAMVQHEFITKDQAEKAMAEEVKLVDKSVDPFTGKYPYYVDAVLEEAIAKYGFTQDELLTGGYKIYTELDPKMQAAVEESFKDESLFNVGNSSDPVQSGAVLVDAKSGGIRALVGGRGEHVFRGYNRATQLKAQPGSVIKPIVSYTPALEEGWEITDMVKDEKMSFGNYQPSNYNDQYEGEVPMYEALMESKNIAPVWLLNELGIEKGLESVKQFGLPLEKEDRNLAVALGGLHTGVSPKQMAEAFSVFANRGVRTDAHTIIRIEDPSGQVVAERKEEKKKVTTAEVADKMNAMLLGVVEYGTGKSAQIEGREVAGKTGSTQVAIEGIDGVKDQWFVGYTPDLVSAVWIGYDKTDKDHYLTTTSSEGAGRVFQRFMTAALEGMEPTSFNVQDVGDLIKERERKSFWNGLNEGAKKWEERVKEEKKKWEKKWKEQGKKKDKGKEKGKDKVKEKEKGKGKEKDKNKDND
ncbi:penicillin-binding protein [Bacillus sp. FJAT-27225]|uniref:transglycosylase domain-containing protein n=1 Tax=Bacillus sp. FJAT-27225 TaxID=1743144 RepID=UPI00080C220A|nr:penicillin-binding protein 1A [Bacillus sp. FJAT-27225]OCA84378.1 penicillin-binding protein [Bacillus sp. FJAT-27225]